MPHLIGHHVFGGNFAEGFDNVSILNGGFRKWKEEGREIKSGIEYYPKATFNGRRRRELLATKEDVKKR